MNLYDPLNMFHLSGTGVMRYMTLALPVQTVRSMLPNGLELAPQSLTPAGTHPVMLGFHDMFRLHTSFPSLLPSMSYHEHSVGIPFCYINQPQLGLHLPGPYFYMPIVMLDHLLATIGGLVFWGFAKRFERVSNNDRRYEVARMDGTPILCMEYSPSDEVCPIRDYPDFEPQRQALAQTVVSIFPAGMGPYFVLSQFPKNWATATLQPITARLQVFSDYVLGFSAGSYPAADANAGSTVAALEAYELQAPWKLSSPYPALY